MRPSKVISVFTTLLFFCAILLSGLPAAYAEAVTFNVSDTSPDNAATDVEAATPFVITFTEDIAKGTGYSGITVLCGTDPVDIDTTVSGAQLSIAPHSGAWDNGKGGTYTVTLPQTALLGTTGNDHTLDKAYTFTFATKDTKAPDVVSANPAKDTKDVDPKTAFTITFDENIVLDTSKSVGITVSNNLNAYVKDADDLDVTVKDKNLIITPKNTTNKAWDAGNGVTYTLTIPKGMIKDTTAAGNATTSDLTYSFTTWVIPDVTDISPEDGSSKVDVNTSIVITFNTDIQSGTAYDGIYVENYYSSTRYAITKKIEGKKLTITPTSGAWPGNKYLQVYIPAGAVQNTFGAASTSPVSSYFRTIDISGPSAEYYNPSSGSTSVDPYDNAYITFDRPIYAGPNYSRITATCNGAPISVNKTISYYELRFSVGTQWLRGRSYVISIPAGAVKDADGFPNASALTLKFSVAKGKVDLEYESISPSSGVILKGKTFKVTYNVDVLCNISMQVKSVSSGKVIRTLTKPNVSPGSFSMTWDGNKSDGKDADYGQYQITVTATAVDSLSYSPDSGTGTIYVAAKASLKVLSQPSSWNRKKGDLKIKVKYNTGAYLYVYLNKGSSGFYYKKLVFPSKEGSYKTDTIKVPSRLSGGGTIPKGKYKVTYVLYNGASESTVKKSITIK